MGLNIAVLVGDVITDPQVRKVGEKQVTAFRVGDGKATHNVSVFEAPDGISKGAMVVLQGRISNRNMAKEGEPARWITEVTCSGTNVTVISAGDGEGGDDLDFG